MHRLAQYQVLPYLFNIHFTDVSHIDGVNEFSFLPHNIKNILFYTLIILQYCIMCLAPDVRSKTVYRVVQDF